MTSVKGNGKNWSKYFRSVSAGARGVVFGCLEVVFFPPAGRALRAARRLPSPPTQAGYFGGPSETCPSIVGVPLSAVARARMPL